MVSFSLALLYRAKHLPNALGKALLFPCLQFPYIWLPLQYPHQSEESSCLRSIGMLLDTLIPFQGRNITQAPAGLELPNVSLRDRQAGNGARLFPAPCLYGMGWFRLLLERHFPSVSCEL